MKQLAIYCSPDLEHRVVAALEEADVEGFVRVGDVAGTKLLPRGELPRTLTWDATMLIVPAADDTATRRIVAGLEPLTGNCEVGPCLRVVISNVERVL